MSDLKIIILILLISPGLSIFLSAWRHNVLTNKWIGIVNIIGAAIPVIISLYLWHRIVVNHLTVINQNLWLWLEVGKLQLYWGILLDKLNIIMLNVVTITSLIIQIYHSKYIIYGLGYARYYCGFNLGIIGILLVILANNFFQLFCGWQLLGIASYVMINSNITASKALFFNYLGNFALLLGIGVIWYCYDSLDYAIFLNNIREHQLLTMIVGCLVITAVVKSAQMPLHLWLPEVIQGGLPISEFMHTIININAGMFLLLRFGSYIIYSKYWLNMLLIAGSCSAVLASLRACVEIDLKKIIAYSTISQVGIIIVAIGSSASAIAMLHLINYGLFQGLLILSIGTIFLITQGNSNILELPLNIKQHALISYIGTLISCLILVGAPLSTSFYLNNLLIINLQLTKLPITNQVYNLLLANNMLTGFYAARMFFLIFYPTTNQTIARKINKLPRSIIASIGGWLCLTLCGSGLSYLLYIQKFWVEPNAWGAATVIVDQYFITWVNLFKYGGLWSIGLPNLFTYVGIIMAFFRYIKKSSTLEWLSLKLQHNFLFIFNMIQREYYFNDIANGLMILYRKLVYFLSATVENSLINHYFNYNLVKVTHKCSRIVSKIQGADLNNCIVISLSGVIIILLWFMVARF